MLVGVNYLAFNLQLSNIIIVFLSHNVTSVVQPLDQEIIASFRVQLQNKFLEWGLSQFDSTTTHQGLRNIVPNVWQVIMWCPQVRREMNLQIIQNN